MKSAPKPCIKGCGRPADKKTGWCKICWAAYMRTWRRASRTAAEARMLKRGAERLRDAAVAAFRGIGNAEMTGHTAAEVMRRIEPK